MRKLIKPKTDPEKHRLHAQNMARLSTMTPVEAKAILGEKVTRRGSYSAKRAQRYETPFTRSESWVSLRYSILVTFGRACMCCGTARGEVHVDHIKPRSKFPELSLDHTNLQVLCRACNLGKSDQDQTDWRTPEQKEKALALRLTAQFKIIRKEDENDNSDR